MGIDNKLMFNFEKLESWHLAIDFADLVYSSHVISGPTEMFRISQCQMRRAAVVGFIESCGGSFSVFHEQDFARFTKSPQARCLRSFPTVSLLSAEFLDEQPISDGLSERRKTQGNAERPSKLAAFYWTNSIQRLINHQPSTLNELYFKGLASKRPAGKADVSKPYPALDIPFGCFLS